jgi:hypothetical protein
MVNAKDRSGGGDLRIVARIVARGEVDRSTRVSPVDMLPTLALRIVRRIVN